MSTKTLVLQYLTQPRIPTAPTQAEQERRAQAARLARMGALLSMRIGPSPERVGPHHPHVGARLNRGAQGVEALGQAMRQADSLRRIDDLRS